MPAPIALAPLAWKVAQLGAVAAVTYYAARIQHQRRAPEPRDIWRETALNDVEEGVQAETSNADGTARLVTGTKFKRGIRMGATGPGIELELTTLSRLKIRKI